MLVNRPYVLFNPPYGLEAVTRETQVVNLEQDGYHTTWSNMGEK